MGRNQRAAERGTFAEVLAFWGSRACGLFVWKLRVLHGNMGACHGREVMSNLSHVSRARWL